MSSIRGDSIRSKVSDSYEKTAGYLLFDMTEAVGLELDEMDGNLINVQNMFDVNNLTGDDLTRFVYQRKGVARKAPGYASGIVTVTGTGTVEIGDLFETENGVQFAASETVSIAGSGDVPVIAVVAGASGNVGTGAVNDMPVTISGISAVTNSAPITGGYDAETDEDLRERYYEAIRTPASNGNKASYKIWAKSITGVGDAKVFPLAKGTGTVDVVIIDADMTPADASLVNEVQNYIDPGSSGRGDGIAPIGATCYVSSATGLSINVSASITLSSSASSSTVETAIKEAITNYLANIAFDSSIVSAAQVGNVILDVPGVQDYENLKLNSATGNVTVGEREVAVIGTVTFTYA